jgi:short-subunit dehydrogenase
MVSPLAGRRVLITGAARGIGAQVARLAADRGARLALVGLELDRLRAVASDVAGYCCEADVTDQAAVESAVAGAVDALGGLDVVMANAGVSNMGTVAVSPISAMMRTVDVNLGGVIRTVHATLPHVLASRGYFLLVSSAAAFTALPGIAAYGASKAGVEHFGNVLRMETRHRGVRVGIAHPSWVDTDLTRDVWADLTGFRDAVRRLPGPFGATTSVEACAETLVRAVERRKRRVYVPRAVGLAQALRTVTLSPLGDRLMAAGTARGAGIDEMEAQVRGLGRYFGRNSVAVDSAGEVMEK